MEKHDKYLKLIAIRVGDFESTVQLEENYPYTEEGRLSLDKDKKIYESEGLICISLERDTPFLTN